MEFDGALRRAASLFAAVLDRIDRALAAEVSFGPSMHPAPR